MLAQLKMLADAMYRGYWARDAFKYRSLGEEEEEVSNSCAVKRFRMLHGRAITNKARCLVELNDALMNFLLQHDSLGGAPAVLPIIGAPSVGKRTLVAHVCKDERVSEQFSSIVHLNGETFRGIADHDNLMSGKRILLIVEIVSN
ncbi:hypothetical protein BRADI_3g21206v3 [Brachypodium distachyon]|uniref:NB-ARC domain-containing protein n=1 Tax=Brachypodium distachyon TaxID=15368 RepID=A0A2K2CYL4_BRADI|nr:hypothetical protein BRADI_3g21206v3 [Brachypodium distachyon]